MSIEQSLNTIERRVIVIEDQRKSVLHSLKFVADRQNEISIRRHRVERSQNRVELRYSC